MLRKKEDNTYKIIAIIALVVWCLANISVIAELFGKIFSVISPFVAGCFLAFAMNVLLRPIERVWDKAFEKKESKIVSKLKRPVSIIVCMLLFLGLAAAVVFIVIPGFTKNFINFVNNIPQYTKTIVHWWDEVIAFASQYGVELPKLVIDGNDIINSITDYFSKSGGMFINATIDTTATIVGGLVKAVLAVIFAIYILARKERICELCKKSTYATFKLERAENIIRIGEITDSTFTNFISGQFIEACCFGILVFIGMVIFKFPFAGMIAVEMGFTALIPILGAFIGLAIGAFLILLVNPIQALWFIVFICLLQQLDNNLIYPRIVGKSVGLPGLLVLLAVTIGGSGFGVLGMLVSVPVCAILYELYKEFVENRLKKRGLEE